MTDTNLRIRSEILLLVAFCGFLFFYGLGAFGLLGADEPRYAQIAREMLDHADWITPTLNGKPWLEKPPLYYWQAMLSYRTARLFSTAENNSGATSVHARQDQPQQIGATDGVTEISARLPDAIDAALLIAAIYLFLRRSRPGSELDGALITASCAGVIAFARAAATDMPLAATFTIALLSWYTWYENRGRAPLAVFYAFLALGMLAKGPVAPALAAVIVILFAIAARDRKCILDTLWLPGIALFLIVALPWYIAVQIRNPQFFRFFILEQNLARFSTNVYHHPQPFWFFVPVFLLALMPWTVWLVAAVVERLPEVWSDNKEEANIDRRWSLFLLIWTFVPVVFFSMSRSKLPGYILPAVPAAALLVTEFLANRDRRISRLLAIVHGILCGALVFAALSAPGIMLAHRLVLVRGTYIAAAIAIVTGLGIIVALVANAGPRLIRSATMIAVIISVAAVIRFAAPAIDATQSARPLVETIRSFSHEPVPVALYRVNRVEKYGLEFYFNRPTESYDQGEIPPEAHLLVAASGTESEFRTRLGGRKVSYLTSLPAKKLELYWVGR